MALQAGNDGLPLATANGVATPHGIYRKKYHVRALFQSIAFLVLLGGYHVSNNHLNGNSLRSDNSGSSLGFVDSPVIFPNDDAPQEGISSIPVPRRLLMDL